MAASHEMRVSKSLSQAAHARPAPMLKAPPRVPSCDPLFSNVARKIERSRRVSAKTVLAHAPGRRRPLAPRGAPYGLAPAGTRNLNRARHRPRDDRTFLHRHLRHLRGRPARAGRIRRSREPPGAERMARLRARRAVDDGQRQRDHRDAVDAGPPLELGPHLRALEGAPEPGHDGEARGPERRQAGREAHHGRLPGGPRVRRRQQARGQVPREPAAEPGLGQGDDALDLPAGRRLLARGLRAVLMEEAAAPPPPPQ